jgi:hypothetical protein
MIVHAAYRIPETGEPGRAVCAADAEGPRTTDLDEFTCLRCSIAAIRAWWDL